MKNGKNIDELVEETLAMADNFPPSELKPFFYTRVKVRLERTMENPVARQTVRWSIAALAVWIMLNAWTFINQQTSSEAQQMQRFKKEYNLGADMF